MGNCCFNEGNNTENTNLLLIDSNCLCKDNNNKLMKFSLRDSKFKSYKEYIKSTQSKEIFSERSNNLKNPLNFYKNDINGNTTASNNNNYASENNLIKFDKIPLGQNSHNSTLKRVKEKEIKDKEVNIETLNIDAIVNRDNKKSFSNNVKSLESSPPKNQLHHNNSALNNNQNSSSTNNNSNINNNDPQNNSSLANHNNYLFSKFNYLFDDEPKIGRTSTKNRKKQKINEITGNLTNDDYYDDINKFNNKITKEN